MFLTWSPLTAPYKAELAYDHSTDYGGAFPYTRASLNRELKRGLINDCMTDVVVYGGANGQAIRRAAKEAVCQAMGGRIDGTACDVPEGASPAALAVTESLGSKLVFDAILSIWAAAEKATTRQRFPDWRPASLPPGCCTWWPINCRCSTLPARRWQTAPWKSRWNRHVAIAGTSLT